MSAERDSVDEFLARAARGSESESEVLPGDDERIDRIERAVQRRDGAPARPRARQVAVAVACGLLLTGVAFVALRVAGLLNAPPSPTGGAAATPGAVTKPAAPVGALPPTPVAPSPTSETIAPLASAATPAAPAPVSANAPHTGTVSARPNAAPASEPERAVEPTAPNARRFDDVLSDTGATAASLFAAANSARVAGDAARSIQLSQQLLSQFPRSAEATSTHLSLGMLLLRQGQAGRALGEFEAYERGSGASRAEALWGKAQALQKLGRASDEKAALRELVEKYPHVAYTAAAQKRLAVLP